MCDIKILDDKEGKRDYFMKNYFQYLPVDCKQEIFKKKCRVYFKCLKLLDNYGISKDNAFFDDDNNIKYKETNIINHNGNINLYYRFYNNMFIPKNMLPKHQYMQIGDRIVEQEFKQQGLCQQDRVKRTYIFLGFIDLYCISNNLLKLSSSNKMTNDTNVITKNNIVILKLTKNIININKNTDLKSSKLCKDAILLVKPLNDFESITNINDFKIIIGDFVSMYYHVMQPSIALHNKFNFKKIFEIYK